MTHLGLVSASAVASKGFPVVCYDADSALIKRLAAGELPVSEPGLDGLVRANGATSTVYLGIVRDRSLRGRLHCARRANR